MKIQYVPLAKIHIDRRYRADEGDIEGLAANIREMGLLQPIGIDEYYHLIFGARRLRACGDILGWKTIPCVILKVESLLAGEYAENEFRKQFTPSERAAIGEAIEKELGNRAGRPTAEKVANLPQLPPGTKTRDHAAKAAGFKSARTYEATKTVTKTGAPELKAAMDAGRISIDAAAKIATQPKAEQKRIVELPKDQQREVVRQIRQTKADKEAVDKRAYDLRVFRGLAEAVEHVANHHIAARETWEGLTRVSAFRFSEDLDKAIACLVRLQKEHPNAPRKPGLVTKTAN